MYKYILFDLDGTLTDPKEGITKSVQYALKSFGIEEEDLDKLEPFIGPPLKDSFMEFYGFDDAQAEAAVEKYREYFQDTGIFQNEVYTAIPQLLAGLQKRGKHLAVASSKPTVFVERILEHFDLRKYFEVVVGSELDGTRVQKEAVIRATLRQLVGDKRVERDDVVMVGDRKFDIEAGRYCSLTTMGVTYGYGTTEELKAAKAEYIFHTVTDLGKELLRKENIATPTKNPGSANLWTLALPIIMAFLAKILGHSLGIFLVQWIAGNIPSLAKYLIETSAEGELVTTPIGGGLMTLLSHLLVLAFMYKMGREIVSKVRERSLTQEKMPLSVQTGSLYLVGMLAAGLGLNLLFDLADVMDMSAIFQSMQEQRYSLPFVFAILIFCVVAPLGEELLFRGIVFNRLNKMFGAKRGVIFTSIMFGLYHGNSISCIYAFAMSLLITWAYERTGKFYLAVLLHALMNFSTYVLSYTGAMGGMLNNWPSFLVLAAISGVCIWMLLQINKKPGVIVKKVENQEE